MNSSVIGGILRAFVEKKQREHRGKGLQNMPYETMLMDFSLLIRTMCPRLYRQLQSYLPLPHERTLLYVRLRLHLELLIFRGRKKEASKPRKRVGIHDDCFTHILDVQNKFGYAGTWACSTDETALAESRRVVYDSQRDAYLYYGCVGEPVEVPDVLQFETFVNDNNLLPATKVRYFIFCVFSIATSPLRLCRSCVSLRCSLRHWECPRSFWP